MILAVGPTNVIMTSSHKVKLGHYGKGDLTTSPWQRAKIIHYFICYSILILKVNFIKEFFIECKWFGIHTCHNALIDVRSPFSGLGSLLPWVQGIKVVPSLLCVSGVFNTEPSFLSRLDMWLDMLLLKKHVFHFFAISIQECVSRIML